MQKMIFNKFIVENQDFTNFVLLLSFLNKLKNQFFALPYMKSTFCKMNLKYKLSHRFINDRMENTVKIRRFMNNLL